MVMLVRCNRTATHSALALTYVPPNPTRAHAYTRTCPQTMQERGVASLEDIRVDEYTGKRFTFFADPDDLPLELYET